MIKFICKVVFSGLCLKVIVNKHFDWFYNLPFSS